MLYTIGYEGLNIDQFISQLRTQQIGVLIDVRELPLSRKKGFSKQALAEALRIHGITYLHLKDLGAPRAVRYRLRETGNWSEYCTGYQKHLAIQVEALEQVSVLAADQQVCLMCFEADHRECHRSLIATRLSESGRVAAPVHLSPRTATAEHSAQAV